MTFSIRAAPLPRNDNDFKKATMLTITSKIIPQSAKFTAVTLRI